MPQVTRVSGVYQTLADQHQSRAERHLVRFFVDTRVPVHAIDSPSFVDFCRLLNPLFQVCARMSTT
jgi:hypothetical protein